MTGQPDFYTVTVTATAPQRCIESKCWKLYLWSFRERNIFCEALASELAQAVLAATDAERVTAIVDQVPRGGIGIRAQAVWSSEVTR